MELTRCLTARVKGGGCPPRRKCFSIEDHILQRRKQNWKRRLGVWPICGAPRIVVVVIGGGVFRVDLQYSTVQYPRHTLASLPHGNVVITAHHPVRFPSWTSLPIGVGIFLVAHGVRITIFRYLFSVTGTRTICDSNLALYNPPPPPPPPHRECPRSQQTLLGRVAARPRHAKLEKLHPDTSSQNMGTCSPGGAVEIGIIVRVRRSFFCDAKRVLRR